MSSGNGPRTPGERILVIRHGAFGDIIQMDGALRDIRAHHPAAAVTVLTTPPYRRLFERCPHVGQVVLDPRAPHWRLDRLPGLWRMLRRGGFSRVYDLQNSTRTAFYRWAFFRGVPWSGKAGTAPGPRAAMERGSVLEGIATQLAFAGVPVVHTMAPDVRWMAADVGGILTEAGVGRPYVVLMPGSSAKHPHKRWPGYPALAAALRAAGYDVVTAPGPDEQGLAGTIPGATLTGPKGFLDWFELAGLCLGAALVVGNDTGPTHLAAHEGVPVLALFGPHARPERTGILRPNAEVIAVADLAALPAERVAAAALRRLSFPDAPGRSIEGPTPRGWA